MAALGGFPEGNGDRLLVRVGRNSKRVVGRFHRVLGHLRPADSPASNSLPGPPRPLDRLAVKVLLLLFEQREPRVIFRHYPRSVIAIDCKDKSGTFSAAS